MGLVMLELDSCLNLGHLGTHGLNEELGIREGMV